MDESGRLAIHATGRTLAVLREVERLVHVTQTTSQVISPAVEQHLLAEQQAFLKHVELIQANARQRILSLADWTPPSIGPLERFLGLFGLHLHRREKVAEDEPKQVDAAAVNEAHTKEEAPDGTTDSGNSAPHHPRPQWSRPAAANGYVGEHSHTAAGAQRVHYRV